MTAYFDMLGGRVTNISDCFPQENWFENVDMDFIVNGINSIPLHQRLNIDKQLFSENELKIMEAEASNFFKNFQDKLTKRVSEHNSCKIVLNPDAAGSEFTAIQDVDIAKIKEVTTPADKKEEEDSDEIFLKHLYDPIANDSFIQTLKKNRNKDFTVLPTSEKREATSEDYSALKVLDKVSQNIAKGKYDQFLHHKLSPSSSPAELSDSEDDYSIRAQYLSSCLNFELTSKFSFLKKISEDSLKMYKPMQVEKEGANSIPVINLSSDYDSDNYDTSQFEINRGPENLQKTECDGHRSMLRNPSDREKSKKNSSISSKNKRRNKWTSSKTHSNFSSKSLEDPSKNSQRCSAQAKSSANIKSVKLPVEECQSLGSKENASNQHTEIMKLDSGIVSSPTSSNTILNVGASTSQSVKTKKLKEVKDEGTSSVTGNPSSDDIITLIKSNDSSEGSSTDEDWIGRANENLSYVDKLLLSSKRK